MSFPPGMPGWFDPKEYGLHPVHLRTAGGFIWVSFAEGEPPDFEAFAGSWSRVAEAYGTRTTTSSG